MKNDDESFEEGLADRVASDWLDDSSTASPDHVTPDQKRRIADLLWIQGLLETTFQSPETLREHQIQRAMASIRDSGTASVVAATSSNNVDHRSRSRWRQWTVWVTAAVLVLSVGIWLQSRDPRRQAFAAIERIREAASAPSDREYLVTLFPADANEIKSRPVEAQLFVRGGEAFVVKAPALLKSGDVWFGHDRNGAWFKPAIGPVLSGSGALLMQQRFMQGREQGAPFLQLTTVLERLSDAYRVTLLPDEVPDRGSLKAVATCQHLRAVVRPIKGLPDWLPGEIEIYAERETGTIIKMVLHLNSHEPNRLKRIQFDFIAQSQLPDDWYRPEGRSDSRTID